MLIAPEKKDYVKYVGIKKEIINANLTYFGGDHSKMWKQQIQLLN